jgi:uncharacterized membrane protein
LAADPAATASHRGHLYIQWVLRGGLALAVALMMVGVVAALATGERAAGVVDLHALLAQGSVADRLIAVGLALLALTPVVRVLALVLIWLRERDRRFVVFGLIVLAILAFSIASGRGG